MSQNRTLVFIAVSALALAGAAFATLPATAEGETVPTLTVTVDLTSTSPRVAGTITVLADGVAVPAALIDITSTHDDLPLPAAETSGATGVDGTYTFDYGLVSTASVPGDHTLTVVVDYNGASETVVLSYTA